MSFSEDTPQSVRVALEPLIAFRRRRRVIVCKVLDYKKGEQTRGWYQRHRVSAGNVDPEIIPYYLLLIGPPDLIPFDFQYLLGVEYAVGCVAFDTADRIRTVCPLGRRLRERQCCSEREANRLLGNAPSRRSCHESERVASH